MTLHEHLFISDVHLGAFSKEREQQIENDLITLIKYATRQKASIFVLGDLFDYWMEYPGHDFTPALGKNVLDAFEEYNRKVKPAVYIMGNHDNWTFGHFENRGFDVEPNYRIIEIEDKRVLLMHGDGQFGKRDDFLRPKFHKLLRNSTFVNFYQKAFPPKLGLAIMSSFSELTRKRNYRNPVPLNKHASKILDHEHIEVVLCGHDHIPRLETFSGGCYINLGTFFDDKTLVRCTGGNFELVTWVAETKEFVPYNGNSV